MHMSLCMGAGVMYIPVACVCLLCIQMSTLCEQLVTLASNGLSQSTDISPGVATSAVTTLVEENTHLKEDIESDSTTSAGLTLATWSCVFLDATPVIFISLHHVRRKTVYIFIVYIYTYVIHSFLEQKISNTLYKCISTAKKQRCRCIRKKFG